MPPGPGAPRTGTRKKAGPPGIKCCSQQVSKSGFRAKGTDRDVVMRSDYQEVEVWSRRQDESFSCRNRGSELA